VDVERVLQLGQHVLARNLRELLGVGCDLARSRAQAVDAEAPGELRDPGTDRVVLAKGVQALVDAREDLLEDVLGIVLREPEGLGRDGIDVAREPLDQGAPGFFVTTTAACDEPGVGKRLAQRCWAARRRFASVSSSFQAIEAFDSTSGRNSQEVSP
jgi:hypothetical protein